MKGYYRFYIDQFQVAQVFSPIRRKKDVIAVLMRAIKYMLVNNPPPEDYRMGEIILVVSRMSRVIFVSANKIFTINFPFFVKNENDELRFYSASHDAIDSKVTSNVLGLIESEDLFSKNDVADFFTAMDDASGVDKNLWWLLKDIALSEDGYLRYDYDLERNNGRLHPLNHVDVFYSSSASIKLGLYSQVNADVLVNIMDSMTDCHYLSPYKDSGKGKYGG